MRMIKRLGTAAALTAAAAALTFAGVAPANAATIDSWIGPWTAGGINYLHYSTISNSPSLVASSRIYTVDGNPVPQATIGARARLFKSGALCKATNYQYNSGLATQVVAATTGDCGAGSYNSHGFVQAWNGTSFNETFTFPTNPLNYTVSAPGSRASSPGGIKTGVNDRGQTFGSAEGVQDSSELPTLVAAYATNGQLGYIPSSTLNTERPSSPQSAATSRSAVSVVDVLAEDGVTVVGEFVFN